MKIRQMETVEQEITRLHQEILGAAKTTLEKARRIGELLVAKKQSLAHGEWLPWFTKNCKFSTQSADRYRAVFIHWDEIKFLTVENLTDAYRLLDKANNIGKEKTKKTPKVTSRSSTEKYRLSRATVWPCWNRCRPTTSIAA